VHPAEHRGGDRVVPAGDQPAAELVPVHTRVTSSVNPSRATLLLEYDDERSGTFDPLRLVPGDKVVVLGLVTTKTSRVEPLDQIKARLALARSVVDADRLALSPQCGFATSVAGNAITAEAQRAKLALLVRAARDFLGA
jgi:methionine synthase II (cobalamin-independent)